MAAIEVSIDSNPACGLCHQSFNDLEGHTAIRVTDLLCSPDIENGQWFVMLQNTLGLPVINSILQVIMVVYDPISQV